MKSWDEFFTQEEAQPYYQQLMQFLEEEYKTKTIFPPKEDLFTCFKACPYEDVKVVMLGQDPYHEVGQAHGLCFSVRKGVKIPPSLRNMYKELKTDLDIDMPSHGYLIDWAKQGVFMMNAVMSVVEGKAGSHQKKGWETFTDHAIQALNEHESGIVFLLWGNWAQKKAELITNPQHKIITSAHPSPLSASRGFFGSRPFSKTNAYLKEMGRTPIEWKIEE
ncbi:MULTISPECIES: uracil-DNA glycosylase [Bacillota]|jgi:uracil-DNA glycosylase|uniref:Uracil-DNA glycosylase n=2 Tax=Amedibacillus TaxID=2749846 RepID=A0A7G9GT28_9FIRM|nr:MULTISPECIES: uracil-DNA glycosylase [Bacillota]QNM13960.1 uracil-DNA glycosylase [[Eubacterium] hominis]MCH4283993.1 uracil-DNA glycosylase [Amedibacillus hominis]RGB56869.1 uracil-DNA glycosylase [Absiella sp. AM22-9]RGB60691.1 uracil-DNA glycosylase [Absiella sp. AM10-20]RGB64275.1 uracil-DNA glycosylase [Absiella sp. AM09-45]